MQLWQLQMDWHQPLLNKLTRVREQTYSNRIGCVALWGKHSSSWSDHCPLGSAQSLFVQVDSHWGPHDEPLVPSLPFCYAFPVETPSFCMPCRIRLS